MLKPKTNSILNSIDVAAQSAFNLAYHRSKNEALQRAREVASGHNDSNGVDIRHKLMQDCARWCSVDPDIDYDNMDPYIIMQERVALGKSQVDAFMPPGAFTQPPIKTSVNVADYPPINPPRSFTEQDYRETVQLVIELGFDKIGNEEYRMVLPGGHPAAAATRADLRGSFPPPPTIAPWATILHFGICINGVKPAGELIVDAEEVANQDSREAARAYIMAQAGL